MSSVARRSERSPPRRGLRLFRAQPRAGHGAAPARGADKEESEFVRPALTRALAAYAQPIRRSETAMNGLVMQGQDLSSAAPSSRRSATITPRTPSRPLMEVAKLDGPLQEDAVLASGKIGDKRALEVLAALQRTAPRVRQPAIAAAICLLGINCASHQKFVVDTLTFAIENPGFQDLLRGRGARAWQRSAAAGRAGRGGDAGRPRRAGAGIRHALADGAGVRHGRAAQHAVRRSSCSKARQDPKRDRAAAAAMRSTCSKRISKRSGSSRPCAARTGRRPRARRRARSPTR